MSKPALKPLHNVLFKPVMDWWICALVGVLLLLFTGLVPMVIWQDFPWQQTTLALIGIAIAVLYVLDSAFFMSYHLTDTGLVIATQFRHYSFPYRTMDRLQPGTFRNLITLGRHHRFSLSSHCLIISLRQGNWKTVSISPQSQQMFVNALLANIDHERTSRTTHQRRHED